MNYLLVYGDKWDGFLTIFFERSGKLKEIIPTWVIDPPI